MTLIELLVVIIILSTLVAAAIPLLSPTNADRRLREASRGLNSFISSAQMRAVELRRPFGVGFKRLGQDTNPDATRPHDDNGLSLEVFYVEQPPPFVGFDETAAMMVAIDNSATGGVGQALVRFVRRGNDQTQASDDLPIGWDPDPIPPFTIRQGDVVKIRGTHFTLTDTSVDSDTGFYTSTSGTPDGTLVCLPANDTGQLLNTRYDNEGNVLGTVTPAEEPFWTYPSSYQVLRQPMPVGEPFQLPEGTAIDLRASGEQIVIDDGKPPFQRLVEGDFGGFFYNPDPLAVAQRVSNSDAVIVMFSPEGSIERVKFNRKNGGINATNVPFDSPVVSNVFILVGRPENLPPLPTDDPTLSESLLNGMTDEQLLEARQTLNWLAGESRWIVIGARSGRVVTVENAFVDRPALNQIASTATNESGDVRRARQINAARELARDMAQLGGR
jgi:type II secretory pathway pseudopilin PulG